MKIKKYRLEALCEGIWRQVDKDVIDVKMNK